VGELQQIWVLGYVAFARMVGVVVVVVLSMEGQQSGGGVEGWRGGGVEGGKAGVAWCGVCCLLSGVVRRAVLQDVVIKSRRQVGDAPSGVGCQVEERTAGVARAGSEEKGVGGVGG
jgi:hypothetical protein